MAVAGPQAYTIELGPIGPIGEGEALILRVNRNCPWNRCLFCRVYKGKKFSPRSIDEINGDIDAVRRVDEVLSTVSWEMGLSGRIQREVLEETVKRHPEVYGEHAEHLTTEQWYALQSLSIIANWISCGARRVFLQDANALVMKPNDLIAVLGHLKNAFRTVDTVTCYARSQTSARRSHDELSELHDAGLSWCFVGVESGCDEVLQYMQKGVTQKEHIEGGRKVMDSGIRMAAFVMPGLAGSNSDLSHSHIVDTAHVLNEIRPTEVRVRSLAVLDATPLYERWQSAEFSPPGDK